MRKTWFIIGSAAVSAALCWYTPDAPGQGEASDKPAAEVQSPRPAWKVGDRWIVETASRPIQAREDARDDDANAVRTRWQFEVQEIAKLGGREAFRIAIVCLEKGPAQPQTTLWVDQKSLTLRQVQTQLPTADGFRTITESYEFHDGQPAPVMTPLTALPIDLPVFLSGGLKGDQKFEYTATPGPTGKKALGDVSFAFSVSQSSKAAEPARAKSLLHDSFSKDLTTKPAVEIHLKSSDREVQQLWRGDLPWPVFVNNGTTQARLVEVLPANTKP